MTTIKEMTIFRSNAQFQRFQQYKNNEIIKRWLKPYLKSEEINVLNDVYEWKKRVFNFKYKMKWLRHMQARVFYNSDYALLVSYATPIAVIDFKQKRIIDFLELVYGYTATSSKQVTAFINDYAGYTGFMILHYKPVEFKSIDNELFKKFNKETLLFEV